MSQKGELQTVQSELSQFGPKGVSESLPSDISKAAVGEGRSRSA
jgi:hypothetical protein